MPADIARPRVFCFGEILWDVLPEGKQPGGAPMNVAYHLQKAGIETGMISRVGDDAEGGELKGWVKSRSLNTSFIQTDTEHATSHVLATVGAGHEVTYDIVTNVAWDYIAWDKRFDSFLPQADALVFGSLAARNEHSRETLLRLLKLARYKVFDVNLREPHYTQEGLFELLPYADLLKLNEAELALLGRWLGVENASEAATVAELHVRFNIPAVLLTKGGQGAAYYGANGARYELPAKAVKVADTIGSGDSFLGGFLSQQLKGAMPEEALKYAIALSGFVTSQKGACPDYRPEDIVF